MQTTPSPVLEVRRPRRKGELTAERILDAAEALFAERGFAGATLRDVAARVGLRNPSLYNHFSSKEEMYAAVLRRGIGPVLEVLVELVESEEIIDSPRVVDRIMERLERHPNLPRLILQETLAGGERLTPMLREWIAPAFARAQEILEADPAAARWKPEQVPLLVLALYHVVVGYFTIAPLYRALNGEELLSRQALATQTQFLGDMVRALLTPE